MDSTLTTAWRSPSNIAIVKYWGKHGHQLPANPSLSITLTHAFTETHLAATPAGNGKHAEIAFLFDGREAPAFAERIRQYFGKIAGHVTFVKDFHLSIASSNTFPHSSGIASSASAMSALALCLADLQCMIDGHPRDARFWQIASELARIGSGSGCRSVYGPVSLWGETSLVQGSSDTHAIPVSNIHPVFETLCDSILIVDAAAKAVSSSAGHALMEGHPYRNARIAQVQSHLQHLLPAMQQGDIETFGKIAEAEALSLHALMMTSDPSYILMRPHTVAVIEDIRAFRTRTDFPVYFTLDAGPNVHVLYPRQYATQVQEWIQSSLISYCVEGRVIHDHAGNGPVRLPS